MDKTAHYKVTRRLGRKIFKYTVWEDSQAMGRCLTKRGALRLARELASTLGHTRKRGYAHVMVDEV